jgi:hypothetical protein
VEIGGQDIVSMTKVGVLPKDGVQDRAAIL